MPLGSVSRSVPVEGERLVDPLDSPRRRIPPLRISPPRLRAVKAPRLKPNRKIRRRARRRRPESGRCRGRCPRAHSRSRRRAAAPGGASRRPPRSAHSCCEPSASRYGDGERELGDVRRRGDPPGDVVGQVPGPVAADDQALHGNGVNLVGPPRSRKRHLVRARQGVPAVAVAAVFRARRLHDLGVAAAAARGLGGRLQRAVGRYLRPATMPM